MALKAKQHRIKVLEKRKLLWPELQEDELWNRKEHDGFTSVPRTMPIILNIIDDMTKGQPASATYFALWMKAYDEMYVNVTNREEHAHYAGYYGQRAIQTWQKRVEALADLGFILTAEGMSGIQHVVILNPHIALERLHKKGHSGLLESKYMALKELAIDIRAKDVGVDPRATAPSL